jgi:hypothetical protein
MQKVSGGTCKPESIQDDLICGQFEGGFCLKIGAMFSFKVRPQSLYLDPPLIAIQFQVMYLSVL